ncbi:hypothetical protein SMICM17S_07183 [Streptomyces microflavus]
MSLPPIRSYRSPMRREYVSGPWSTLTEPWFSAQVRTAVRCGSRRVTRSPLDQVRSIRVNAGPAGAVTRCPFTRISGSAHQAGTRSTSGKRSGFGAVRESVTVSVKG